RAAAVPAVPAPCAGGLRLLSGLPHRAAAAVSKLRAAARPALGDLPLLRYGPVPRRGAARGPGPVAGARASTRQPAGPAGERAPGTGLDTEAVRRRGGW